MKNKKINYHFRSMLKSFFNISAVFFKKPNLIQRTGKIPLNVIQKNYCHGLKYLIFLVSITW